jgi:hypothetical protein
MGRPSNAQIRINRLIEITSSELKKMGLKDIATPALLNNAVTLALKTKGNCETLDDIITELETRRETIDDIPSASYLSALVSLLTKGEDSRDDSEKSLQELLGTEAIVGKVKRV